MFCKKNSKPVTEIMPPDWAKEHPAWLRLEDQLGWYDSSSTSSQSSYKILKFIQLVLAVGIPVVSNLTDTSWKWIVAFAGATIAVVEAIQHMNQYSTLWVMYRSTAERLKHEKFLFLSAAGPYRELEEPNRLILLAERVEEHVSTEHANWFNETRRVCEQQQKVG